VRCGEDTTINEDMLFSKPVKRRASPKNSSNLMMISLEKKA
jgi:hypothetical protein